MPKSVIVLLAEGFEEVEAITPIDYLRRVGIEVIASSISGNKIVKSARGIGIQPDVLLDEFIKEGKPGLELCDAIIIPGGLPGSDNIASSVEACNFIKEMAEEGRLICAICAAPARVLSPLGLLAGKRFTCYPGEEEKVLSPGSNSIGAIWTEDRVVKDGNLITSRGAGTAGEFSLEIISSLLGKEIAKDLSTKILI